MRMTFILLIICSLCGCSYRLAVPEDTMRHVAQQSADLVAVGQALQTGNASQEVLGGIVEGKAQAILKLIGYECEQ